ncbi:unnamed protein product [Brassicogethes aeneus]|uniref:Uncharacterized protein n=1 Tax=Brassicogethes aeneus TaxID=1431903 RepID=A0A9P0AS86_BRAAE|nr:unnamed protein product [Brassicogethes aeneus]
MKVAVFVIATLAVVLAEPPAPSNQYIPSNQYGPPNGNGGGAPNNQYGAPAQTQAIYGPPNGGYLPPGGGYGGGKDEDEGEPANYQFKYDVEDAASGNEFGHEEERQGDVARGKYYVLLPDGRRQTVEYTADNEGYKPKITYEQVNNGGYQNGGYPANGNGGGNGGYQY